MAASRSASTSPSLSLSHPQYRYSSRWSSSRSSSVRTESRNRRRALPYDSRSMTGCIPPSPDVASTDEGCLASQTAFEEYGTNSIEARG